MAEILKSTTFESSKKRMLSTPSQNTEKENVSVEDIEIKSSSKSILSKSELREVFADEINEIKEIAYSESFNKGYEDGKQAATEDFNVRKDKWEEKIVARENELVEKIQNMEDLFESINGATASALKSLEPMAVSIAFAALTQLLGHSEAYRDRLAQQVDHAIAQFGRDKPVRILLNKLDLELMRSFEKLAPWADKFVGQEEMERGSCVIEAGPRSLDAGLIEQLNVLRQLLLQLDEAEI